VKHHYRKTSENLKYASLFNIIDKSKSSVAARLRCGGLISNYFTTDLLLSSLVKQLLKSVNIWRNYRQEDCFTCFVRLGTVLHEDEFAIDFTYDMKKLLLTVVTLVSPLILTLVVTNINRIRPIFTSSLAGTISD